MQYIIEYDAFVNTFSVSLNGRELSKDPYSSFSQYKVQKFEDWVQKLPEECRNTANARYNVCFVGSELHGRIVERVLNDDGYLLSFQLRRPLITSEHRLAYALEKGTIQLPCISVYCDEKRVSLPSTIPMGSNSAFGLMNADSIQQSDIVLVKSHSDIAALTRSSNAHKMQAVIIPAIGRPVIKTLQSKLCILEGDVSKCIILWYREMLLPYVLHKHAHSIAATDREILFATQPIYRLERLPTSSDHVKVGQTRNVSYVKFPPDIQCDLRSSAHVEFRKDVHGLKLHMLAEGDASIMLSVAGNVKYLPKRYSFHVYQDHPVTLIHNVRVSKDPIIVGESFDISFDILPTNATNIGELTWEVSSPYIISNTSKKTNNPHGRFVALGEGQCDVNIHIGMVSYVQRIMVYAPATGLLTRESKMCLKENDQTKQWKIAIEPVDSRGGRIVFNSLQRTIIDVDASGNLYPKSAGRSEIVAELLDHNNRIKATRKLDVEVLPLHSNPEIVQILGICSVIVTVGLVSSNSSLSLISGIVALVMLGISYFTSRSPSVRIADIVIGIITFILMLCNF